MKETLKGAFLIVAAMLIFGFYGIAVSFLNIHNFYIVFFMLFLSGLTLAIFFWFKDKSILSIKKYWWIAALVGLFNIFSNFFYFQAFELTTISNAVLTHYTAPIFVAFLAPIILKEKIEKITIVALVLSIIGITLVSLKNLSLTSNDFIGILYGTGSGLMYGLVIVLVKYLTDFISIYTIIIYEALIGALLMLPFASLFDFDMNFNLISVLILFAAVFGIFAVILHLSGIKLVKSQHAGILAYIEPIAAISYAFIFLSEIPAAYTLVGGGFILAGGYLIIRRGQ